MKSEPIFPLSCFFSALAETVTISLVLGLFIQYSWSSIICHSLILFKFLGKEHLHGLFVLSSRRFFIKLIETLVEKGKMGPDALSFFFLLALKKMRGPRESFMKRKKESLIGLCREVSYGYLASARKLTVWKECCRISMLAGKEFLFRMKTHTP